MNLENKSEMMRVGDFQNLVRQERSENRKKWYNSLPKEERIQLNKKYSKKINCVICDKCINNTSIVKHNNSKTHILKHNEKFPDDKREYKPIYQNDKNSNWYAEKTEEQKKEYYSKMYHCVCCNKDYKLTNKSNHEKTQKHKLNLEKMKNNEKTE